MDGSQTVAADYMCGVGLGVYSPAEAERWVGIPAQRVRSWLGGQGGEPIWHSQHEKWTENLTLGFRDLMEAKIIHALRKNYSLQELRTVVQYARDLIGDERPLSTTQFKTSGPDILMEVPEGMITVSRKNRGQRIFRKIVEPALKPIEYGTQAAELYWPQSKKRTIVLDPKRAFGQPILDQSTIPTSVIARSVAAEGGPKATARLFEIPLAQVRDAVEFENRIAA